MIFANQTYTTLNSCTDKIVVIPLGATEQHGPHLAVGTDSSIVTSIAQKLEALRSDDVLLAPTLTFGSSHHHISFGGTISISPDLYCLVIKDMITSLLQSGYKKIILLNGHGGNITSVKQALALLSKDEEAAHQANIVLATYWELGGKAFAGDAPMESPALSHACEYETSMMLHLFPGNVDMNKAQRAKRPEQNGYIGWEDDVPYKGISIFKPTSHISDNGSSGEPQLGTAAKGEHLISSAVNALTEFIDSFKTWPLLEKLQP